MSFWRLVLIDNLCLKSFDTCDICCNIYSSNIRCNSYLSVVAFRLDCCWRWTAIGCIIDSFRCNFVCLQLTPFHFMSCSTFTLSSCSLSNLLWISWRIFWPNATSLIFGGFFRQFFKGYFNWSFAGRRVWQKMHPMSSWFGLSCWTILKYNII